MTYVYGIVNSSGKVSEVRVPFCVEGFCTLPPGAKDLSSIKQWSSYFADFKQVWLGEKDLMDVEGALKCVYASFPYVRRWSLLAPEGLPAGTLWSDGTLRYDPTAPENRQMWNLPTICAWVRDASGMDQETREAFWSYREAIVIGCIHVEPGVLWSKAYFDTHYKGTYVCIDAFMRTRAEKSWEYFVRSGNGDNWACELSNGRFAVFAAS